MQQEQEINAGEIGGARIAALGRACAALNVSLEMQKQCLAFVNGVGRVALKVKQCMYVGLYCVLVYVRE
jgi:hypothetical protein